MNEIRKILVQKGQSGFIQYVGLVNEFGMLTSINYPDTETMHSKDHWKIYCLEEGESLAAIENTNSFENILFYVCKLPNTEISSQGDEDVGQISYA